MTFYETLAIVMKEKGIKPSELSERTGLNEPYFSKLKKGTIKDVTWEKALLIIDALGMTPDEFYELQLSDIRIENG